MTEHGLIFNIQKFSLHDGPGIRTTVFFKGCPLSCLWCHNSESQSPRPQLLWRDTYCSRCGQCMGNCPEQAISLERGRVHTAEKSCRLCGECLPACPKNSREICGETMAADTVLAELLKDRVFFRRSGGGITCSGGEPLAQPRFLSRLLNACKRERLHTVVDTSGYAPWESFERILQLTDLFLYDLKLVDDQDHRKLTGVSNRLILDNLKRLSDRRAEVRIRIPIIPGITDRPDQLEALRDVLEPLGYKHVHLLPFHQFGRGKAERIGRGWQLDKLQPPSDAHLLEIKHRFEEAGFWTLIGG